MLEDNVLKAAAPECRFGLGWVYHKGFCYLFTSYHTDFLKAEELCNQEVKKNLIQSPEKVGGSSSLSLVSHYIQFNSIYTTSLYLSRVLTWLTCCPRMRTILSRVCWTSLIQRTEPITGWEGWTQIKTRACSGFRVRGQRVRVVVREGSPCDTMQILSWSASASWWV